MKFINKVNSVILKAKLKCESFMRDERGDTNFISILVILGIALALAAVFLTFKDKVLEWVDKNVGNFFQTNAGR